MNVILKYMIFLKEGPLFNKNTKFKSLLSLIALLITFSTITVAFAEDDDINDDEIMSSTTSAPTTIIEDDADTGIEEYDG